MKDLFVHAVILHIIRIRSVKPARKTVFLVLLVDALNVQLGTIQVEIAANHVVITVNLALRLVFASVVKMDITWITKFVWNNKEMFLELESMVNLSSALLVVLLAKVILKTKSSAQKLLMDMYFHLETSIVATPAV